MLFQVWYNLVVHTEFSSSRFDSDVKVLVTSVLSLSYSLNFMEQLKEVWAAGYSIIDGNH